MADHDCRLADRVSVIVPEVVIGLPPTVRPVEPVTATLVTDPPPVPAPMAVRNVDASRALTLLSAFTRRNVMADGFASVNRFPPTVVAPSPVRAPAAVVAPVPPLATASVPASVIVPEPVIGPPEVVRPVVPPDTATDVT